MAGYRQKRLNAFWPPMSSQEQVRAHRCYYITSSPYHGCGPTTAVSIQELNRIVCLEKTSEYGLIANVPGIWSKRRPVEEVHYNLASRWF
jgi:hypothetical protein